MFCVNAVRLMDVKVSVIIPVFNGIKYLDECVSSVTSQVLREIEIIIVDDGSTDGSGDAADRYAAADTRIRVIHQKNSGVSSARNAALKIATGDFIGFVDSDDIVLPEMFNRLYEAAEEYGAEIVTSGYRSFNEAGENAPTMPPYVPEKPIGKEEIKSLAAEMHKRGSFLFIWRSIFSRRLIEENGISFDTDIAIGEDTLFCMECYLNAQKAVAVGEALYRYRLHSGSAMRKKYKPQLASSLTAQYEKKAELCRRYFLELADDYYRDAARQTATAFWCAIICNIYQNNAENKMKQLKSISRSEMFIDCFKYFDVETQRTKSLDTIALCELSRGRVAAAHLLLLAAFRLNK